jgi:hypothetical protein
MDQVNKFFIHFWLAFSVATLIWAIFRVYQSGWAEGGVNFFVPVVAFFWYIVRRATFKRIKRNQQDPS